MFNVYRAKSSNLMEPDKKAVHDFWEDASCGEKLYLTGEGKEDFLQQAKTRYELEPYVLDFAEFDRYKDAKVLEVGIGLGADHQLFANAGAILFGIDLTKRSVIHACQRFSIFGLNSMLQVADAESLPFRDDCFDLVYSWGVLHHTPDTAKAIDEILRVLRPGGAVKAMIYHKYSLVGYMLWLRYALMRFRPMTTLREIYSKYLESPGTKAYTVKEARELFGKFRDVNIRVVLTHADLLLSSAGQRHEGMMLYFARLIWPRWFFRSFCKNQGLCMTIKATK